MIENSIKPTKSMVEDSVISPGIVPCKSFFYVVK